jgi:hypothetical protein
MIGKVLVCLRRETETADRDKVDTMLMALTSEMNDLEKSEVMEVVMTELKDPSRQGRRRPRPSELEYVFEDTKRVAKGERLILGTRVIRGPDWDWDNQDGGVGNAGTVIGHHENRWFSHFFILSSLYAPPLYPFSCKIIKTCRLL